MNLSVLRTTQHTSVRLVSEFIIHHSSFIIICALLLFGHTLQAQTTTWDGSESTDWFDPLNWSAGVPGPAYLAIIPNVTNDPTISAAGAVAKSVVVSSGGFLTIAVAGSLAVSGSTSWGVDMSGTVENNGAFSVNNITFAGILMRTGSLFTNKGSLQIGNTEDIGYTGISNNAGTFVNESGSITVDRTGTTSGSFAGIVNKASFTNQAVITIGGIANNLAYGLWNDGAAANFMNQAGGSITIDRIALDGLLNQFSSSFTNQGSITIGAVGSIGSDGIENTATFNNSTCTALINVASNNIIRNTGTFSNAGFIIENASGNSSITTNTGVIQNLNGGTFTTGGTPATTTTGDIWTGCTSTDWATAGNWFDGSVPTAGDDVTIPDVTNDPVIGGGTAAVAKSVSVNASASLTINDMGSLTINGSTGAGLANSGTVSNAGSIVIGSTTPALGGFGLTNSGTFTNLATGSITINRSSDQQLRNLTSGTFTNSGQISIGDLAGANFGIYNEGTFVHNGGNISIPRANNSGILNDGGGCMFTSSAPISILTVLSAGPGRGIYNRATFTNNTGSDISIDRCIQGIFNEAGSFTNTAKITFGATTSVTTAIQNNATFNNSSCAALLNAVSNSRIITSAGTFTNAGFIIENASGNSNITTNTGVIQNLNGGTFTTGGTPAITATGDIWTGCTSTDWATAGNWLDGTVPTATDDAVIPDVTNDPIISTAAVARSVNVLAGGSLMVASTGSLTINSDASPLFTNSGTVVNEGTISLNTSASFNFHRLLNLETGTFTNNNVLQLGNSGSQTIRGIYNRGSFVNATGGSISIAKCTGGIFQDAGSFVNNADIVFSSVNNSADSAAIVLFGGTFSNTPCSATILDQPGCNLSRFSAAGGTFTNDGLLTENSSGSSNITSNTGIVQNLGGGSFSITNNSGVLTTDPGPQNPCFTCPATGTIWYVNALAVPGRNGASWECAFKDLQLALAAASSGDQIWVASGTYKPTPGTDRSISFVMKNGVEILGGFPNTGDPGFDDREWVGNVTTLSGDIGAPGISDNSYHVVFFDHAPNTTLLDGFTISGGNGETTQNGGGIYNDGSGVGRQSNPRIANCTITGNVARSGGGLFNDGYKGNSSPEVTNCVFSGNKATRDGGGVYNFGGNNGNSTPVFTNGIFSGNKAERIGGGVFNDAVDAVGGVCNPAFMNCSFSGNQADFGAGGMYNDAFTGTCSPAITNCILWGNAVQIDNRNTTPVVAYSIVQGGHAGTGNLDTNPLFVSQPPVGLGTSGDLHLQACSPAIDAATDAGAPTDDLDGNARPFDAAPNVASNFDMGAYEYQELLPPPTVTCQNLTVQLDADGSVTVLATDVRNNSTGDCGTLSFLINGETSLTYTCDDLGNHTVTLTVTDAFDNTADCEATIIVADDINPCCAAPEAFCTSYTAVLGPGGTATVAPANVDDGSTAECGLQSMTVSPDQFDCSDLGPQTVTLTVTDINGDSDQCVAIVTVVDNSLPGITCPGPITVTCSSNVPAVNLAAVTATDNCGAPVKSHLGDVTSNQTCASRKTITRTYRATDGSGNSTTCAQVITVFDNVKPNFTSVPANVTVQCNSIPAVGTPTATDGCGGSVSIAYNGQTSAPGACPDASTITRQWTATDACGNTKTVTQRITVIDSQKPNFVSVPANITVQCSAIPNPATPTATDNCDAVVAITYNGQTQTNGACANAYTLTRRWTAEDNCGNTRSISQRITVVDNGKPVFTAFPPNTTITCDENPPEVGSPTASDGCGTATVTYLGQSTTGGNCPGNYQIRRTWRATDACGNTTAATQTIQVSDNGAPVFVTVPGPITIECNQPLPPLVNPTASDACGGYVHITFLGNVPTGSGCANSYMITRTWRAQDLCGNTATVTQVITVVPVPAGFNPQPPVVAGFNPQQLTDALRVETRSYQARQVETRNCTVSPNPTTDHILLDLTDFAGEAVTISIFSDLGQLVWENRIPAVDDLRLPISLREAGAAAGIYTVSVRSTGGVVAKRVVLVE